MPTVELFWFNASKAYQSDPSILIAPLKKLAPVPGCKESGVAALSWAMMLIVQLGYFMDIRRPLKTLKCTLPSVSLLIEY